MRTVLVIEDDTLIRELMREHLEREGYVTCAVPTVRIGLEAARWTTFGLVLLDFASAAACGATLLRSLREHGAPVVMMRSAPAGTVIATEGEIEQVVWSPFDLSTLTAAVRRFLPTPDGEVRPEPVDPAVTRSGTYLATSPETILAAELSTLPAPPDGASSEGRVSLEALGVLVLEATGGRSRR